MHGSNRTGTSLTSADLFIILFGHLTLAYNEILPIYSVVKVKDLKQVSAIVEAPATELNLSFNSRTFTDRIMQPATNQSTILVKAKSLIIFLLAPQSIAVLERTMADILKACRHVDLSKGCAAVKRILVNSLNTIRKSYGG